MAFDKAEVVRAVKKHGMHGAHFQFRDLREALRIEADDRNASSRLNNHLKSLVEESAVEEVPGSRKRNKYFRIKNEEKLRELAPWPTVTSNGVPRAPDRLARIEATLQSVLEKVEHLDAKVAELAAAWS